MNADSSQTSVAEKGTKRVSHKSSVVKVQLTEPTQMKRDDDPFGRILPTNNNLTSETRKELHSPGLVSKNHREDAAVGGNVRNGATYYIHRTPPPGNSKKKKLKLGDEIEEPRIVFDRQKSFDPASVKVDHVQRSPHFFDQVVGPSQATRKEKDVTVRKYSPYRKARDAMTPNLKSGPER